MSNLPQASERVKFKSPAELAKERFWSIKAARVGMSVLGLFFIIAIYAPFIASEQAFIWIDEGGMQFPLFSDLFNKNSYSSPHDLLFNLAIFVAPLMAVLLLLSKRLKCGLIPIISNCLTLLVAIWLICLSPVMVLIPVLAIIAVSVAIWIPLKRQRPAMIGLTGLKGCFLMLWIVGLGLFSYLSEVEVWAGLVWKQRIVSSSTYRHYIAQQSEEASTVGNSELPSEKTSANAMPFAIFPLIPHTYNARYPGQGFDQPMTANKTTKFPYVLGTDRNNFDVMARMAFGSRISLTIGLVSTGIAMFIGIVIGAISGYSGGWIDLILQRLVEIMMTFPTFILILVVISIVGPNIWTIMVVIGVTGWAGTARMVRGEYLGQMGREYILACQSMGLPKTIIMFRHILPNIMTPLFIGATFSIAGSILTESGLAFLGLGDNDAPSWGTLLTQGREQIRYYWLVWVPGLAIFILVSSLNLVGNALQEALNPKGR